MTAMNLLASLRSRGVALVAVDDRLRWTPREALTAEDIAQLREHKAEILALLAAPDVQSPDPAPERSLVNDIFVPEILDYFATLVARDAPLPAKAWVSNPTALEAPALGSCFGNCSTCGAADWRTSPLPLTCRACGHEEPQRFTGKGTPRWPEVRP